YPAIADIYLGDTSSQVIEFIARPRPCVFLNNAGVDWRQREDYGMWSAGEVVDSCGALLPALEQAPARHGEFAAMQRQLTHDWLGETSGAPERIVEHI